MEAELIELAMKIKISRRRTRLTTYENMELYTTQPIKPDKKKEIKRNIPSNYADFNYYNRMKQRRRVIEEMVYNSFEAGKMVMLTLTFDSRLQPEKQFSDIKTPIRSLKNSSRGSTTITIISATWQRLVDRATATGITT